MQLEDFKIAVLRVFYDIVNADGIIDVKEIRLLEELKKKYGLISNDGHEDVVLLDKAHSRTFSEALTDLYEWKYSDSNNEYAKKYSLRELYLDAKKLANIDSDCSANEALLLLSIQYMLDDEKNIDLGARMISCKTRNLRFSKHEILYVEDDEYGYNEDLGNKRTLNNIQSKLRLYGFEFAYIPEVAKFLSNKNEGTIIQSYSGAPITENDSFLSKIMMFTHPLLLKDIEEAKRFSEELKKVTTSDFVNYYFSEHGITIDFPALMLKVKTSRRRVLCEQEHVKFENFQDFLLIPIVGDVESTINEFLDRYIELVKCVRNYVILYDNERVHCKGFHKTLLDYIVYKSKTHVVDKVIFDINHRQIMFDGTGEFCYLPPVQFVLYMLFVARKQGVMLSDDKMQSEQYKYLYYHINGKDMELNYYNIGQYVSKMSDRIERSVHIENKQLYIPYGKKKCFVVDAPQELFFVREHGNDTPLRKWFDKEINSQIQNGY